MSEEEARAIFLLAGIPVLAIFKIENDYWPSSYVEARQASPWWLIKTAAGLVRIGWRKRVISIDWSDTGIKTKVTDDEVTQDETMVHAYGHASAVRYLSFLGKTLPAPDQAQA